MMRFDEKTLAILDRKRARVAALGHAMPMLHEIPRLLRWVRAQPMLRAYTDQIVRMHDADDVHHVRAVDEAIQRLPALAADLRALPFVAEVAAGGDASGRDPWPSFDHQVKCAEHLNQAQRDHVSAQLARVLHIQAMQALAQASNAERLNEVLAVAGAASRAAITHTHRLQERALERAVSPRTALVSLVNICRALNNPVRGVADWTDFLPRQETTPFVQAREMEADPSPFFPPTLQALDRFVEELHVLGASTLSHRALVERFKERCCWYDKARMRAVARSKGGTREDRLTLELAKYLHDSGLFVLVRTRMSNLEPDIVGLNGLAVEAKAHTRSASARKDIIHGYYQLHAYMTSLETGALRANEGFLVVFRLDGPIYETPATIDTGRFLIHSLTIDLGLGATSGRKQSETRSIDEEEIFSSLTKGTTALERGRPVLAGVEVE